MRTEQLEQKIIHLWKTSLFFQSLGQNKFSTLFMDELTLFSTAHNIDLPEAIKKKYCSYCYNVFDPGNTCTIKLITNKTKKKNNKKKKVKQNKNIDKKKNKQTDSPKHTIKYHCTICDKNTYFPGITKNEFEPIKKEIKLNIQNELIQEKNIKNISTNSEKNDKSKKGKRNNNTSTQLNLQKRFNPVNKSKLKSNNNNNNRSKRKKKKKLTLKQLSQQNLKRNKKKKKQEEYSLTDFLSSL
eukprot:TRINITY_DN7811_c0_g1_i2.p1 TRINITY_DN7811_c0_g1~~TRINITY_DN7811_c0_g1_i2.p1  ORF type:complete len:241 (-),score=50.49 TRINITY_DN7811_c0_g1_i2:30-752(-)